MVRRLLAVGCLVVVAAGAILHLAGAPAAGDLVLALGSVLVLVPLTWSVARSLAHRDVGVDAIALLAIAGALALGQWGAAAVVALMLAGGNALEEAAAGRARRELRALVERAPRVAHRIGPGGSVEELPVDRVMIGDSLVVRAGEIVPVDGVLTGAEALVDESSMTGESLPVLRERGDSVRSGASNAGDVFELRAVRPAAESAYAAVLRLVQEAESSKPRFVRLADRYAIFFLPLTIAVAVLAWALSGDPVRAVAVLVVATPCPLILAAPIAIVAGISRAARRGIIVKGGGALEALARGSVLLFDKTGTLTRGRPTLTEVAAAAELPADEMLRLAASLDQASAHVLAASIVTAARDRGLALSSASAVTERHGYGIEGVVDGHRVRLGKAAWAIDGPAPGWAHRARRRATLDGSLTVFASVDGRPAGVLLLTDPQGRWKFSKLPEGRHVVRVAQRAGWTPTAASSYTINLKDGQAVTSKSFGERAK